MSILHTFQPMKGDLIYMPDDVSYYRRLWYLVEVDPQKTSTPKDIAWKCIMFHKGTSEIKTVWLPPTLTSSVWTRL